MLLVYALVGRYSVADLQPGRSFVENLLREGLDVYAIDWGHPTRADRWTTLDDYVNVLIDECVDVLRERHRVDARQPAVDLPGRRLQPLLHGAASGRRSRTSS